MAIDTVIDVESDEENVENNKREKDPLIVNRQENADENGLYGKTMCNEDEAYKFYNSYATRIGFSVRKGKNRRDAQNVVRQINFLCSKEGFQEDGDPSETKKTNRLDTRTGCKAMIRFTLEDEMWKVSHFHAEHNHDFAKPEERPFLRSNRRISDAHKGVIKTMFGAGIRTTKTYSYLAEEVGGSQNVGFTKRDCYNFVNREKMAIFEAGDAQSLINLFKHKQFEDPMFFYSVQVDQENRMTNFFWRDGRSRLDYDCFGDVVVFDTTYRTNRYNMICAPFVGVNNHWKNVLFGCAFLLDETTASFIWLFETFLESMGNQTPKIIYTDQCQAMANAIKEIFPRTCHRLCLWHISLNATRNIGSLLGIPEFKKMFNKCLYGCESESEFQSSWDGLLETFDVAENDWLKRLYTLREKFCAAFSLDKFSARIQSSQRRENTNNVFHHISAAKMRLIEFVQHYDRQVEDTRSSELEETFRCTNGVPSNAKKSTRLLYHAGKVYTRKLYNLFGAEIMASMAFKMDEVETTGTVHTFKLNEEGRSTVYVVKLNSSDSTITCTCKMFESMGLLCRHALGVVW
ncbi:hypothetical protein M0R45_019056 [Rubus argutus]|uniref:SWIM-type domain-containing protein n=1 Tax=Rubus argutus TaxID=59490 RepID=A0AAW1X4U4_RUBAR